MKKLVLVSALWILLLFLRAQVQARVYFITNTSDTTSGTSLRGAIIDANKHGGLNIIIFKQEGAFRQRTNPPVVLRLTRPGSNEEAARTGDLDIIHGELSIIGPAAGLTIDATGLGDRIFQVFSNACLTLENVNLVGGAAPQAEAGSFYYATRDAENGGAIFNAGVLILKNCVIATNSSGDGNFNAGNGWGRNGGDGGGIYNSGILRATGCAFAGNFCGAGMQSSTGGNGGGIKNDGSCFLTNCLFNGNRSGSGGAYTDLMGDGGWGGSGGAIFNSGKMIMVQCIIRANAAGDGTAGSYPGGWITVGTPGGPGGWGGSGGGICNDGQMQINFSTVCDNTAGDGGHGFTYGSGSPGGAGGNGAGIFNAGQLSLNTSTISGNSCGNGGAGGNGTFFGGAPGGAAGSGGGVYNAGSLNSTSCTVALNQTGAGGNGGNGFGYSGIGFGPYAPASGGNGGNGGGILNDAGNPNAILRNTLIGLNLATAGGPGGTNTHEIYSYPNPPQTIQEIGNAGADGIGFDLAGDLSSQGFNLVSIADGSTGVTNGITADQTGSEMLPIVPLLGPLQMNGGATPTHALLPGGPAIDQGNSFGIHTDQRGQLRPHDNPAIPNAHGGDGSDIGAFELQ